MKIELNKKFSRGVSSEATTISNKRGVVIGRVTKTREMLDINGNVIDPRTKQIIKRNVEEKLVLN
jgi:hypothetical protein